MGGEEAGMKASSRFKIVHKFTKKEFWGRYKNHDVQITREHKLSDSPAQFYIGVTSAEGYLAYDSYWPHAGSGFLEPTMEAAIEQALIGSQLLKAAQ
jgi:hypothetical protein